ncbi:MAG: hypothetical protein FWD53_00970 [Phycisphaerales bacterium]|nr:hypothetical protein [Phycisphaerales bacterium]
MTVAEQIESRIARLKLPQQRALLTFLDTIETSAPPQKQVIRRKGKSREAEVSAAMRAIAGMWKDRTDLPKDSVEAVKAIRQRMKSRGRKPHKNGKPQTTPPAITKRKLHPALRAIAGMWKDRTDLPKDGAAASMVLRRRVMGRNEND